MEIHELNTFSGTLGASDYFVTDNGTDTSKVPATDITDPLNARIDNIIAGGTAPSEAEVTDARLGATVLGSVQYASLGAAVRGQATALYNEDVDIINTLIDYNAYPLIEDAITRSNGTTHGITFSWSGKICTISGTSDAACVNQLVTKRALSNGLVAGKSYPLEYKTTNTDVQLGFIFYDSNNTSTLMNFRGGGVLTVPSNAVQWALRLYIEGGKTFSPSAVVSEIAVLTAPTNDNLYNTSMRELSKNELASASSFLDIPTSKYFSLNGARIRELEPNFPFAIQDTYTYMAFIYAYLTNYRYVHITTADGRVSYVGWTAVAHPTTFTWKDMLGSNDVNILIFGNSSTYSTWGYAPSLLSEFCPSANFRVGLLYYSGQSLSGHIDFFNNDTPYSEYSEFRNGVWTNTANSVTGKNALGICEWDIIIIQQSNGEMMSGTGKADADTLCSLISNYINYPTQFVLNMPMTKGANCSGLAPYYPDISGGEAQSDAAFADFADYCQDLLNGNYISHVIPCGTAVQNARHTSLKQYGAYQYLCVDDVGHLQNGIGVLCASYVAAYKTLEIINEKQKLFASPLNPTDTWLTNINLYTKTMHGACVGISKANKILAQKCALQAIKKPMEISVIV